MQPDMIELGIKIGSVADMLVAFVSSPNLKVEQGGPAVFSTAHRLKYEWAASLYIMLADMLY